MIELRLEQASVELETNDRIEHAGGPWKVAGKIRESKFGRRLPHKLIPAASPRAQHLLLLVPLGLSPMIGA